MSDDFDWRTRADFASARARAFLRGALAYLTGRPTALLMFAEVKEKLRLGGPIYRGVREIEIVKIRGSVDRYRDFDNAFLPLSDITASRWMKINRAWYDDVGLPPVLLYKVGDVYFVVDGHHRVSVAREQGQLYIEAEVRECAVRVPLTGDVGPDQLEVLGEQAEFLERTALDRLIPQAGVDVTILGGYDRVIEHIAVHRYFMGIEWRRDIDEAEAVTHWHAHVFLPVVTVIRESGVLEAFPKRTAADLYLWVLDHRHYLVAAGRAELVEPAAAAEAFLRDLDQARDVGTSDPAAPGI